MRSQPKGQSPQKLSIGRSAASLVLALVVAVGLVSVDGALWPMFRKFTALEYVDTNGGQLPSQHEIHVPDFIGHAKSKRILVSGTCYLLSAWCTRVKAANKCSVAKQLETELYLHGKPDYRVLNVAIPAFVAEYNLKTFLENLDDPAVRVFFWHNDFSTKADSENNPLSTKAGSAELRPLYERLGSLKAKYPDIEELGETMSVIRGTGFREAVPVAAEPAPTGRDWSGRDLFSAKGREALYAAARERAEKNTLYLRDIERRFPEYLGVQQLPAAFDDMGPILSDVHPWEFHTTFDMTDVLRGKPASWIVRDDRLTVRLIGKLAEKAGKRIVLFFGPEGRCDREGLYDRIYKRTLTEAVKGLPAVRVLDFTDMNLAKGKDVHTCHQLSYSGSAKVAARMYQELSADGVF